MTESRHLTKLKNLIKRRLRAYERAREFDRDHSPAKARYWNEIAGALELEIEARRLLIEATKVRAAANADLKLVYDD